MWEKIAGFVLRQRVLLIILLLLGTAFMGWKAGNVQMTYDNPSYIPESDSDYVSYRNFKKVFGDDGSIFIIGIETEKLFQLDFFNSWYDLSQDIESTPGVKRVLSIANVPTLTRNRSLYKFEQKPVLTEKPKSQKELDSLKELITSLRFYEGLLFADSSNVSLMAVTLERKYLDSKDRIALVNTLTTKINNAVGPYEVNAHFSGLPFIRTKFSQNIKNEIVWFTLFSMLITSLILLFFFRSIKTLIFCNLVVAIGVVWCLGILVLLGFKITIFIGLLPPLIVVIGIANCIYLLNKYHDEYKNHHNKIKALQRVVSKVGMAVFFTNLTTAIGFGVFTLTGSEVLQEFGATAFLSVLAVYLISLILIPVIFSFLPEPKTRHTKHLDKRWLNGFVRALGVISQNHRKKVYLGTSLVVVLAIIGLTQIKTVGYMVDDISKRDPIYKDLKFFEKEIKGVMPFEIVLDTKKPNGVKDVRTLSRIDAFERKLDSFPEFSRPLSIAQMIKFANQAYYNGHPRRYLIPNILDMGKIMSHIPKDTGVTNMLSSLVDTTYQKARISVQMADVGSERIKEIRAKVDSIAYKIFPPEEYNIEITGTSIIFLKGNDYLINNLLVSLAVAFGIISLIMASIFVSFRMILISLIPNIIPLVFTAGMMGWFGVSFKPSTVLVFSVAFGIAVDFTIHFLSKYRLELRRNRYHIPKAVQKAIEETGVSMIYTAVILFFGFIIFTASKFGGTIALGLFTSVTLVVSLIANLIVLPSLLLSYDKALQRKQNKKKPLITYPDAES